jgi:membrane fusion protein (multidrug efflux system)
MVPAARLTALSLALLAAACSRPEAQAQPVAKEDPAIHVTTITVAERPVPEYLTLTGSLSANRESDIAADASGKVIATYIERGQPVKQGELLATLDARSAALSVTAARAQENLAKSQADLAKRDCERAQSLLDTGAISKAEYDRSMAQCKNTEWSVAAAEAQQKTASKTAADSAIRAPFAGVVGERFVNVGQYVQPSTRVASLYSIDPLRLELTVPEANVGLVKVDLPVDFQVAAHGDKTFRGNVRFISPNVRQASRDLVVEALVPNPKGELRPGMFATVRLVVGERPMPVVPAGAVSRESTVSRVFAVVKGRIEERIVQVGDERDGTIALPGGVKAGDVVVTNPGKDVKDGVRVE